MASGLQSLTLFVLTSALHWTPVAGMELETPGSCLPYLGQLDYPCTCSVSGGKLGLDCSSSNMSSPPLLVGDQDSQVVKLFKMSDNNIGHIDGDYIFVNYGLGDLETVQLRNCSLSLLGEDTFAGMSLLRDLDLSWNLLVQLPVNLFLNLHLWKLDLSHNRIKSIQMQIFSHLGPSLRRLDLRNNHLSTIYVPSLPHLRNLLLSDNPWVCDCHLRPLLDFLRQQDSDLAPTTPCSSSTSLVCPPSLQTYVPIWPGLRANVSLGCHVTGFPQPRVNWYHNGTQLLEDTNISNNTWRTDAEEDVDGIWSLVSTLTISNISWSSLGIYTCNAQNGVGDPIQEDLLLSLPPDPTSLKTGLGYDLTVVVVVSAGTTILVMLGLLTTFFCCLARRRNKRCPARNSNSSFPALDYFDIRWMGRQRQGVDPPPKPPRSGVHGCLLRPNYWSEQVPEKGGLTSLSRSSTDQTTFSRDTRSSVSMVDQSSGVVKPPPNIHHEYPATLTTSVSDYTENYHPARPHDPLDDMAHLLATNMPGSRASIGTLASLSLGSLDVKLSPRQTGSLARPGYVTLPRRPSSPWPETYPGPRTLGDGCSVGTLNRSLDSTCHQTTIQALPPLPHHSMTAINIVGLPPPVYMEEDDSLNRTLSAHSPLGTRHHLDTILELDQEADIYPVNDLKVQ